MRMTGTHYDVLQAYVSGLDTDYRRNRYLHGDFPYSDKVQDIDKRYRWDLFYVARGMLAPHLFEDYTNEHIDTALRRIVLPL